MAEEEVNAWLHEKVVELLLSNVRCKEIKVSTDCKQSPWPRDSKIRT